MIFANKIVIIYVFMKNYDDALEDVENFFAIS